MAAIAEQKIRKKENLGKIKGAGDFKVERSGDAVVRIVKDIRKYFDSIDHDAMMEQLACGFKDRELLDLFAKLLRT